MVCCNVTRHTAQSTSSDEKVGGNLCSLTVGWSVQCCTHRPISCLSPGRVSRSQRLKYEDGSRSASLTWARMDLFVKVLVSPRTRKVKLSCMLMETRLPLLESKTMAGKIGLPSRCLSAFARGSWAVVVLILMRTGISMQWGRIPCSFGTRSYSIQDKVLLDDHDEGYHQPTRMRRRILTSTVTVEYSPHSPRRICSFVCAAFHVGPPSHSEFFRDLMDAQRLGSPLDTTTSRSRNRLSSAKNFFGRRAVTST